MKEREKKKLLSFRQVDGSEALLAQWQRNDPDASEPQAPPDSKHLWQFWLSADHWIENPSCSDARNNSVVGFDYKPVAAD